MTERENELARRLREALPPEDLKGAPQELWENYIRETLALREEFPWCAALDEDTFFLYVACPRVYDEELVDCRALFRRELAPRLEGLDWTAAVLEVNRWCAQHVAYRYNDDPTASALRVYRRGYGRCGEESVFAVNALRSVGIAARQVYAPWWSHCDDNHAWVEVFDGRAWHYLGACEPEPVLDRGWFTPAASRAMLVRAAAFGGGRPGQARFIPVTERYAKTKPVTVAVSGEDGAPAQGARVSFQVLNMAAFREIASALTGEDGKVTMDFGLGGLWVTASQGDRLAEGLFDTRTGDVLELTLREGAAQTGWIEMDFAAPAGAADPPPPLTPEQTALRRAWLREADQVRRRLAAQEEAPPRRAYPPMEAGPMDVVLTLRAPADRSARGGRDYAVSRWDQGRWRMMPLPEIPAGEAREILLVPGLHRVTTTTRLPGGDQLAARRELVLSPKVRPSFELYFRRASLDDLLVRQTLPAFTLEGPEGPAESAGLLGGRPALLVWAEPGREPTAHLLQELAAQAPALKRLAIAVHLVAEDRAAAEADPVFQQLRAALPAARLWTGDFRETAEPVARRMFQDPGELPLALLADAQGQGRYAQGGYSVGAGELLARLAGELAP